MVSWYRVEVSDHDGQIVAIEPEMLCGRDIGDAERATIQAAIDTLAGFIGQPNFREMYANEAHAKMVLMEHYSAQETLPECRGNEWSECPYANCQMRMRCQQQG